EFSHDGVVKGMSAHGQNIKIEDGWYESNSMEKEEEEERFAWSNALRYLKVMLAIYGKDQGQSLMISPWRCETRGLIIVIRNLLQFEQWELRIFSSTMASNDSTGRSKTLDKYP